MRLSLVYSILVACLWAFPACDQEQLSHQLTVINGTGSGEYELGARVDVTADPAEAGMGFYQWEGDIRYLLDFRSPTTTVDMPLEDVQISATYKALPTYELTVENGSGSGAYLEGTAITVVADEAPENMEFASWEGDTTYLSRTDTAVAVVVMPPVPVTLNATYQASEISYRRDVEPIIRRRCASSGCHNPEGNSIDLSTYERVKFYAADVRSSIVTGFMPVIGRLSEQEEYLVITWIDNGAPNN